MFNVELNELKKYYDRVESYDPSQNIGFRSLKNIGVWLAIAALTQESDQELVIAELAKAANLNKEEIIHVRNLVNSLIKPHALESIIKDYEKANGRFFLTVQNEKDKEDLMVEALKKDLDFLIPHIEVNQEQDATLTFLMKNIIKFNWAAQEPGKVAVYNTAPNDFCNESMVFLEADSHQHLVHYGLIKHNNSLYHVMQLGTLQKNDDDTILSTSAFLIEPLSEENNFLLQKDYFDIIHNIKKNGFDDKQTFKYLQTINKEASQKTLADTDEFRFNIYFPNLKGPLKTIEERLGIYHPFIHKTIANITPDQVEYKGIRELIYDEKGGEIKNREEVNLTESLCLVSEPENIITITHIVKKPYMLVYDAQSDFYPYFIANPSKNLEMTFKSNQAYPDQSQFLARQSTFTNFISRGYSLFKGIVSGDYMDEDVKEMTQSLVNRIKS